MAHNKRRKTTAHRPVWEDDKFWDFEEQFTADIENPGAATIYIDRFAV